MKDKEKIGDTNHSTISITPSIEPKFSRSVGIDVEYYASIIDDPEVSEERKREIIEMLSMIIVQFIDIGFGVHPVQSAIAEKEHYQTEKESKETTI